MCVIRTAVNGFYLIIVAPFHFSTTLSVVFASGVGVCERDLVVVCRFVVLHPCGTKTMLASLTIFYAH